MQEEQSPLHELKDTLENLKSVLTIMTESKLATIETVKKDFDSLVNTANQMELEKKLLKTIAAVKKDTEEINDVVTETSSEVKKILKAYI